MSCKRFIKKINDKNKIACFIICLVFLLPISTFFACANGENYVIFYDYFDCPIVISSFSKKISAKTITKIEDTISQIDSAVSISSENSSVFKFNKIDKDESVELNDIATDIIKLAIFGENSLYSITNEKFNIAVYPLKELWQTKNDNSETLVKPTDDEIEKTKKLCKLEDVLSFDAEKKTLIKKVEGAKIDLGGIAKGYALEKIKELLKTENVIDGYVSFGSSSIYIFEADVISIRHPRKSSEKIISISNPKDLSISTSGDYERNFGTDENGKRYSHIIDTESGYPADNNVISATVFGENGALLDGISTALTLCKFDFDNKETCELTSFISSLLEKYDNLKFFICYKNEQEKYMITNENNDNFSLLDNEYKIVNI